LLCVLCPGFKGTRFKKWPALYATALNHRPLFVIQVEMMSSGGWNPYYRNERQQQGGLERALKATSLDNVLPFLNRIQVGKNSL
jgi:hypothetical protein